MAKLRRKPRASSTAASADEAAQVTANYKALSEAQRDKVTGWMAQGNQVGRSWEAPKVKPTRWAALCCQGAVQLARHTTDDDIARAWIALVIGEDDCQTHPVGALIGSLSVTEAERLVELTTLDNFAAAIDTVDSAA